MNLSSPLVPLTARSGTSNGSDSVCSGQRVGWGPGESSGASGAVALPEQAHVPRSSSEDTPLAKRDRRDRGSPVPRPQLSQLLGSCKTLLPPRVLAHTARIPAPAPPRAAWRSEVSAVNGLLGRRGVRAPQRRRPEWGRSAVLLPLAPPDRRRAAGGRHGQVIGGVGSGGARRNVKDSAGWPRGPWRCQGRRRD